MERKSYRPYLFFFGAILALLSFPNHKSETLRGGFIAFTTPIWKGALAVKSFAKDPIGTFRAKSQSVHKDLELENEQLRQTVQKLTDLLLNEWEVETELMQAMKLADLVEKGSSFYQRRHEELMRLIDNQVHAYPAKVIYRDPTSWANSLWIDVGYADNELAGRVAIAKNSPVTVGLNVVGLVDYVGKKQSRVRLITDPGLNPSVRACRGIPQDLLLRKQLDALVKCASIYPIKHIESLASEAQKLTKTLPLPMPGGFYAKGELRGAQQSLWRHRSGLLKGVGFNMDFGDDEGPARDLRTGATAHSKGHKVKTPDPDRCLIVHLRASEIAKAKMTGGVKVKTP